MLRNNVLALLTYYYPVGNTPAADLAQSLPPEYDADLLLLGCGDVRNILFTVYSSNATDLNPARNILLLTLLLDDDSLENLKQIWNIYYHWKIDVASHKLLQTQLKKLIKVSASSSTWHSSPYGSALPFCDSQTLRKVAEIWRHSLQDQADDAYQFNLDHAKLARDTFIPRGAVINTGLRSASPLCVQCLGDLPFLHQKYHEHGGIFENDTYRALSTTINRTFFATGPRRAALHYGSDPLLGFHLATAYAPLTKNCPLSRAVENTSKAIKPLLAAQSQFRAWAKAFQHAARAQLVIRHFTGDALSFCHTLQHVGNHAGELSANLKVHSWTFENLLLDDSLYGEGAKAPTSFDVIDTSNLGDHIGPLNLLAAAAPLMKNRLSSSLYVELLVKHEAEAEDRMANLVCGDIGTVGLLLGVAVVESWTNATAIADVDEVVLDAVASERFGAQDQGSTQCRSRVTWKRLASMSGVRAHIKTPDMVRVCQQMYQKMFSHESISGLMQNLLNQGVQKMSNPFYARASFATLLKVFRNNIAADWSEVMEGLIDATYITGQLSVSNNYAQELYTYLHMVDVHSVDVLRLPPLQVSSDPRPGRLSEWVDLPAVICISVEVPRPNLSFLTKPSFGARGIPLIRCSITNGKTGLGTWCNDFGAVQLAFGKLIKTNHTAKGDAQTVVEEDDHGIHGQQPLVVSFFVPTWTLVQEKDVRICIGLQNTPITTRAYTPFLGLELVFFRTQLSDQASVFLSRTLPQRYDVDGHRDAHANNSVHHATAFPKTQTPILGGRSQDCHEDEEDTTMSLIADFHKDSIAMNTMSYKIDVSGLHKTELAEKQTAVSMHTLTAMTIGIKIGTLDVLVARFPRAVDTGHTRLRVARKSSYVEIVAPVISVPSQIEDHSMLFPMSIDEVDGQTPICLTMPYVNLSILPPLDWRKKKEMQWLITHCSLMFSNRERRIKDANANNVSSGDTRVDFKESIFSLMMRATGLQGVQCKIFSLSQSGSDENHILVFMSSLRLDLANRTAVMDAAALVLTKTLANQPLIHPFLRALSSRQIGGIKLNSQEFHMWKTILPVFEERCRTWSHTPQTCEYIARNSVPPKEFEIDAAPFCSCGQGKLPQDFVQDAQLPHLDAVLRKYAHRIAISPCFAMPYIEDCFPKEISIPQGRSNTVLRPQNSPKEVPEDKHGRVTEVGKCANCKNSGRKMEDGTTKPLLTCGKCRLVEYCCAECQKSDWKAHKGFCKEMAQAAQKPK